MAPESFYLKAFNPLKMKFLKMSSLFGTKGISLVLLAIQVFTSWYFTLWASNNLAKDTYSLPYSGIESFGDFDGYDAHFTYFPGISRNKETLNWNVLLLSSTFFSWAGVIISLGVLFIAPPREKLTKDYNHFINLVLVMVFISIAFMIFVILGVLLGLILDIFLFMTTGIKFDIAEPMGEFGQYLIDMLAVLQCFGFGALTTLMSIPVWKCSLRSHEKVAKKKEDYTPRLLVVVRVLLMTRVPAAQRNSGIQGPKQFHMSGNNTQIQDDAIGMA
jgi:hypothetical protein